MTTERIDNDRIRRDGGAKLCRDAIERLEVDPEQYPFTAAMVALLRKTAWMGELDAEHLARVPCDEILDLADAVLTSAGETKTSNEED